MTTPLERLRHHVSGAVDRGESEAIVCQQDYSHLNAIQDRLFRERQRLALATSEVDRAFRARQVAYAEREEAAADMTSAVLLALLLAGNFH